MEHIFGRSQHLFHYRHLSGMGTEKRDPKRGLLLLGTATKAFARTYGSREPLKVHKRKDRVFFLFCSETTT